MHFQTFSASPEEKSWLDEHVLGWLIDGFLAGTLTLPHAQPLPVDIPAEQLDADLARPELLICTWSDITLDGVATLQLPEVYATRYSNHGMEDVRNLFEAIFKPAVAQGILNAQESRRSSALKRDRGFKIN